MLSPRWQGAFVSLRHRHLSQIVIINRSVIKHFSVEFYKYMVKLEGGNFRNKVTISIAAVSKVLKYLSETMLIVVVRAG